MASGHLDPASEAAPFILTAEMDSAAFTQLNEMRRQFYPAERNVVPAHITLFHRLPGDRAREIKALLRLTVARQSSITVAAGEVKATGTGVAISLRSPQLSGFREGLVSEWWPWLGAQDQAGFRPHITLQNKVSATQARQAMRSIAAMYRPRPIRILGVHLWRYLEGPWEDVQLFRFR